MSSFTDEHVESLVLRKVGANIQGVRYIDLKDEICAELSVAEFTACVRDLLMRGKMLGYMEDQEQVLKLPVDTKKGTHELTDTQVSVLDMIERSGNKGITATDINAKLRLPTKEITKALRALRDSRRVQVVRSIENRNALLYMSVVVNPSDEITGGKWYTESQEFDVQYVKALRECCLRFIQEHLVVSVEQIHQRLSVSNLSRVVLSMEDVEQLLGTLVLDGTLETAFDGTHSGTSTTRYRLAGTSKADASASSDAGMIPCYGCPRIDMCLPSGGGLVNPMTCPYLRDWLSPS